MTVGLGNPITPEQSGTLFFKINDSAAELDDNAGELKVVREFVGDSNDSGGIVNGQKVCR